MEREKKVPDIEYWYNKPYKGFCGSCGRIMWCGCVGGVDALRNMLIKCHWCEIEIDWDNLMIKA